LFNAILRCRVGTSGGGWDKGEQGERQTWASRRGGLVKGKGGEVDTCWWKLAVYCHVTVKVGNTSIMIYKTDA
jgi:hypothetical protein